MADWTEKYRPTTLSEVRGNDKARGKLKEWADTWDDHREAVILHGSPGVGKTSAAHALAADLGWDVMELNASDSRTGDVIDRVAGEAAQTSTLTQATQGDPNRRLLILDEADNLHGNADRGGTRAITRVVKGASQPMVLIANDYYGMSNGLRNACRDVEFRDVSARSIVPALRDVCRKEGIGFEEEALEAIAEQTSGDLRSAINDLQAVADGRDQLTVENVVTGERDRTTDIFDFLDTALKEGSAEEALRSSYDVDETPDDLINWIEDNLPKDYAGEELAEAYGHVAKADRWLGRVRATQNYSYWRYAGDNMTAGVAAARSERKGGWTRWGAPSYWSKLGRSRSTRNKRDDIARKVAEGAGTSIGTARHDVLPFLSAMIHHCKPRELTVAVAARYDLDESDLAFVTGSGETTNKVQGIVEDAQRRREEAAVEGTGDAFLPGEGDDEDEDDGREDRTEEADGSGDGTGTLSDFGGEEDGPDADGDGVAGEGEDAGTDPDERAETVEDDDQQSGLGDFV
jgi:replication factor C large subunit